MSTEQGRDPADPVMENIRGTYDALNVRRVFGDPYQVDGVTVIPVRARRRRRGRRRRAGLSRG